MQVSLRLVSNVSSSLYISPPFINTINKLLLFTSRADPILGRSYPTRQVEIKVSYANIPMASLCRRMSLIKILPVSTLEKQTHKFDESAIVAW